MLLRPRVKQKAELRRGAQAHKTEVESGKRASLPPGSRPPNKRAIQKARTRRIILHAGREVFATRGFETPRIEDVSRAAGISRAAFYLHYKSREELMYAVFEREVRWQLRRYRSLTPAIFESSRKLRGWAERFIGSFHSERQYMLIIYRALSNDPKLLSLIFRERDRVVRSIGRRVPALGIFRTDGTIDPERQTGMHILTTKLEDVSLYAAFNEWNEFLDISLTQVTRDFIAFAKG
jgi:AcrR family transcriptional regulator